MTAAAPRVSTIVAVFNGARYLAETLESLLAQTYPDIEIIVVDDGSTDDTPSIAAGYAPRVKLLRQENQGHASALNTGLAAVSGDLVSFLDADDLWLPEKAERQVARFEARPVLGYSVTRIVNFLSPEYNVPSAGLDPGLFSAAPGYVVSTLMARRSTFEAIGGFDTSLVHANKTEWFLRARARGLEGDEIQEVLVRRRLHGTNQSQLHARRSVDEYLQVVKRSLDRARRMSP